MRRWRSEVKRRGYRRGVWVVKKDLRGDPSDVQPRVLRHRSSPTLKCLKSVDGHSPRAPEKGRRWGGAVYLGSRGRGVSTSGVTTGRKVRSSSGAVHYSTLHTGGALWTRRAGPEVLSSLGLPDSLLGSWVSVTCLGPRGQGAWGRDEREGVGVGPKGG